jgi:hypothetical protein
MIAAANIAQEISDRFGQAVAFLDTHDHIPTAWAPKDCVTSLLRFLKEEVDRPYKVLYHLSAIDQPMKQHRDGQPASDFTGWRYRGTPRYLRHGRAQHSRVFASRSAGTWPWSATASAAGSWAKTA